MNIKQSSKKGALEALVYTFPFCADVSLYTQCQNSSASEEERLDVLNLQVSADKLMRFAEETLNKHTYSVSTACR